MTTPARFARLAFLRARLDLILFLALLLAVFGVAYRDLLRARSLAMSDMAPWFSTLADAWVGFSSAWSHKFLGGMSPMTPGEFQLIYFFTFITGENGALAQRLFWLALLPLSAITMRLFLNYFVSSKLVRVVIPLLYAINGFTIAWFQAGGYPYLGVHVGFPLVMLFLLKTLEEKDGKRRLLNALAFAASLGLTAGFHIYMLVYSAPFLVVFTLLALARRRSWSYTWKTVMLLGLAYGATFLLLLPIALDQFLNIWNFYTGTSGTLGLYRGISRESMLESVRFNFSLGYTKDMFFRFAAILVPMAVFSFLLHKREEFRPFIGFVIVGMSIVSFALLTGAGLVLESFKAFPVLLVLRSPTKLGFMLTWAVFPLLAVMLGEVERRLVGLRGRLSRLSRPILLGLAIPSLVWVSLFRVVSDAPFPFSDPAENLTRFFSRGIDITRVDDAGEISPTLEEITFWLRKRQETEGFFRTVWLPSERLLTTKVLLRPLPATFIGGPELDHIALTLMPLIRQNTREVGKLLAPFNVKYIVVYRGQWDYAGMSRFSQGAPRLQAQPPWGYAPGGDPERWEELLDGQEDLRLVVERPGYRIYENLDFTPHLAAYDKLLLVAPVALSRAAPDPSDDLVKNPGVEVGRVAAPVKIIVDDGQADFWKGGVSGKGTISAPQLANRPDLKARGQDSLELTVGSGEGSSWYFYHSFTEAQDWADAYALNLFWYGQESGARIRVTVASAVGSGALAQKTFRDDFAGWKEITLPFADFTTAKDMRWDKINYIELQMLDMGMAGTFYLDKVTLSRQPTLASPGPSGKLVKNPGVEVGRVAAPVRIIVDDGQADFWKGAVAGQGAISAPQLANRPDIKARGQDSLELTVGSGEGLSWFLYHSFTEAQVWPDTYALNLFWYGQESGALIRVTVASAVGSGDLAQKIFRDDFAGWREITLPLAGFTTSGDMRWDKVTYVELQMLKENTRGTYYLDEVTLIQSTSAIADLTSYLYGYATATEEYPGGDILVGYSGSLKGFPFEYLHGEMMVAAPRLLAGLPYLSEGNPLWAFGEFLPRESIRDYSELANAVVFLGDVDYTSKTAPWIDRAKALLFVHEAETAITDIGEADPWREVRPLEVADDAQAAQWRAFAYGKGKIAAPALGDNDTVKAKGKDSLSLAVGEGNNALWGMYLPYASSQDWSGKEVLSFYWHGGKTGATMRVAVGDSYPPVDFFQQTFRDDFQGWKRISFPFANFEAIGSPRWDRVSWVEILTRKENLAGTWYLDRLTVDVQPKLELHQETSPSYSYGRAISLKGEGKAGKQFAAPIEGYYSVLLRGTLEGAITLEIDGRPLDYRRTRAGGADLPWLEFQPQALKPGWHELAFRLNRGSATLDQVAFLATKMSDTLIEEVFSSDTPTITWEELNPSEYRVRLASKGPAFVVLGEAFDGGWQARSGNEVLSPIPAYPLGWANGFYFEEGGDREIKILFQRQGLRSFSVVVWALSWAAVLLTIALLVLGRPTKSWMGPIAGWITGPWRTRPR